MKHCRNCNHSVKEKFCSNCGQKHIDLEKRNVFSLLEEFFHYFTHLDGKFWLTTRTIFLKPGEISKSIVKGITVRYFKLSTMFLIAALIYFLLPQKLVGYGFINTPSKEQFKSGIMRETKNDIGLHKISSLKIDKETYYEKYDEFLHYYGKLIVLMLIPIVIPVFWMTNLFLKLFKKNQQFKLFDFTIFSLEFNSFIILFVFVITTIILNVVEYIFGISQTFNIIVVISIMLYFLNSFFKRNFCIKTILSIIASIVFIFLYGFFVIPFYQFLSFCIINLFI